MVAIKCPNCGSEKVQGLTEEKYACLACDNIFLVHNSSKEFRKTDEHIESVHSDLSSKIDVISENIKNSVLSTSANGVDIENTYQMALNILNRNTEADIDSAEEYFEEIMENAPWTYKGWYGYCLAAVKRVYFNDVDNILFFGCDVDILYERYTRMLSCPDFKGELQKSLLEDIHNGINIFYQTACNDINGYCKDEDYLSCIISFISGIGLWFDTFSDVENYRDDLLNKLKNEASSILQNSTNHYTNQSNSFAIQQNQIQQNVANIKTQSAQRRDEMRQQLSSQTNTSVSTDKKSSFIIYAIVGVIGAIIILLLLFKAFLPWVISTKDSYIEISHHYGFFKKLWQYLWCTVGGLLKIVVSLGVLGGLGYLAYKIIENTHYKTVDKINLANSIAQGQLDSFDESFSKTVETENRKLADINSKIIQFKKNLNIISDKNNKLQNIGLENIEDIADIFDLTYYDYDDELADIEAESIRNYNYDQDITDDFLIKLFSDEQQQDEYPNYYARFMDKRQKNNSILIRDSVAENTNVAMEAPVNHDGDMQVHFCAACGYELAPGMATCPVCGNMI